MKKTKLLLIPVLLLLLTGCFKRDTMEDINIVTTVYPLEYVTNFLYGDNSVINSIYPDGIDIYTYDLLDKQIKDYSKQDLFIYAGVSTDRDIALTLLNENNDILIIDATYGMEITNGIEELWLNPSNLLMISQNIKNGLEEYITSKYLKQEIGDAYSELKISLSELDADLKVLAENANSKTIVVANDSLKFLEKYGFNVISLENATLSDKSTHDVTNLINNGSIKYIYKFEYSTENDVITNLKNTTKVEVIPIKSIANINDEERDNRDDYIKLMNDNIELLKKETYK